jgi:hypothetical protein
MKNTATASYSLFDPCCPEASITFVPQGDVVEVAETCHPDIPASVEVLPIEEARRIYRLCRSRGMVDGKVGY